MRASTRVIPGLSRVRCQACSIAGALLLAALLAGSSGAAAETARREGGDDALRKAQYLLRQLTADQEKLKTDNAKLQAEVEELKAENRRLAEERGKQEGALAGSKRNTETLIERVKSDGEKYRGLVERYRGKLDELRAAQARAAYLEQAVTERNQWIETCRASNDDLYQANSELLERYRKRGLLNLLAGEEPVTGLARVRTENVVEDYRYKLDDLKMPEFAESTQAPADDTSATGALP
jgi:chromosome segregation ATPase